MVYAAALHPTISMHLGGAQYARQFRALENFQKFSKTTAFKKNLVEAYVKSEYNFQSYRDLQKKIVGLGSL